MKDIKRNIIILFRLTAFLSAFAGLASLFFEVSSFSGQIKSIYIIRISAAIFTFVLAVLVEFNFGKKNLPILLHLLLIIQIISSALITLLFPQTIILNFSIAGLIVFISGALFNSILKNHLIIPGYYILIFMASLFLNDEIKYLSSTKLISGSFILSLGIAVLFISWISGKFNKDKKNLNDSSMYIEEEQAIRFRNFFEKGIEGFFEVKVDGSIIHINNEFAKILGYESTEELISKNLFFDICSNPKDKDFIDNLLEGKGKLKNYRIKAKDKNGNEISLRMNIRLELNEMGDPSYYEGSIQDITQIIRAETEKKQLILTLKKKLKHIPSFSENDKTASNIKTQFITNMRHDIRTPMNSIMGFLTLIENKLWESEEELREFSSSAKTSADSILEIINNILDITKLEAGSFELDVDDFSIKNEVDKVVAILTPAIKEKGLELNLEIDGNIPVSLIGDATRYRQVLLNIFSNAIKFTDSGEILLSIKEEKVDGDHIYISTLVKDTGKGIDEEVLSKIYSPAERNKIKKPTDGAGLGLIIAKELTKIMGGDLEINSNLNEGTEIKFTIKLKTTDISDSSDKETSNNEFTEDNSEGMQISRLMVSQKSGRRILLVEDNPISQKIELKILREIGYSVDAVSSGEEAIQAVMSGSFNLVLMDIEMDGMNGIDATSEIRALDTDESRIPIIAVTAHSSMKDRETCLAAGMDDYIAKPINVAFLKMTIDQWLNRSSDN